MVFDWLKGKRNPNALKNTIGLSDEALVLLAEDFEKLRPVNERLPERVMSYVVDGEGESVLNDLDDISSAGRVLKVINYRKGEYYSGDEVRRAFYETVNVQSPELFLRLSRVYETADTEVWGDANEYLPIWLQAFLVEAFQFSISCYYNGPHAKANIDAETVERMLELRGLDPSLLAKCAFLSRKSLCIPTVDSISVLCWGLPGFGGCIARHADVVHEALKNRNLNIREYSLEILASVRPDISPFSADIVALTLSASQKIRAAAVQIVKENVDLLLPMIEEKARRGNPSERTGAARLLVELQGQVALPLLKSRLETEKSEEVLKAVQECIKSFEPEIQEESLPERPHLDMQVPLSQDAFDGFLAMLEVYDRESPKNDSWHVWNKPGISCDLRTYAEKAFALLQGNANGSESYKTYQELSLNLDMMLHKPNELEQSIVRFLGRKDIEPIHSFRFLLLSGALRIREHVDRLGYYLPQLINFTKHFESIFDMEQFFPAFGADPERIGWHVFCSWDWGVSHVPDAARGYFSRHMGVIAQALGILQTPKFVNWYYKDRIYQQAFEAVDLFPEIPPSLLSGIWEIALGGLKVAQPMAQRCIERDPELQQKLIAALKRGKQEVRATAAELLGRHRFADAAKDIEEALAREKQDSVKVAMMNALQQLGVTVEHIIDRDQLLKEAESGLKKGIPDALSWLAFDKMPVVRWCDSEDEVPSQILTWWIVQYTKLGSPEPGGLLAEYSRLLRKEDREVFALFILEAWIAADAKPAYTHEGAVKSAHASASYYQTHYYPNRNIESIVRSLITELMAKATGSAIKQKGILAIPAAFGGAQLVPSVQAYLKRFYGYRVAQCRALVRMLSWVDDKAAIQYVLSVAARFRTRTIREEAELSAKSLAERKGWTIDELGDRTIPAAGLDDRPELVLDYGNRVFTARLDKSLTIKLSNSDGDIISSLPDARRDDDEALVKEAKSQLVELRKTTKALVKTQTARMYEAMCTQRTWKYDDWVTYLYNHPVMRHLCQRLVWSTVEDAPRLFRPLDDGSLTNARDEEVVVAQDTLIRLAHVTNTCEGECKEWLTHLADYEVEPLFGQLSKRAYLLPSEKQDANELDDFKGHMLSAFKLRNRATALGYTRSGGEDGGWFYYYVKHFPSLALDARIEFSGNMLPENDLQVALTSAYFTPSDADGWAASSSDKLDLSSVPSALLSECWNDVSLIAAEGTGYDPDWEKHVR